VSGKARPIDRIKNRIRRPCSKRDAIAIAVNLLCDDVATRSTLCASVWLYRLREYDAHPRPHERLERLERHAARHFAIKLRVCGRVVREVILE
jgi:hypothetical protein